MEHANIEDIRDAFKRISEQPLEEHCNNELEICEDSSNCEFCETARRVKTFAILEENVMSTSLKAAGFKQSPFDLFVEKSTSNPVTPLEHLYKSLKDVMTQVELLINQLHSKEHHHEEY